MLMNKTFLIHITGTVQGVGFRPFIYNLAQKHGLKGWIKNDSDGVKIKINATNNQLENFLTSIKSNAPKLSKIENINTTELEDEIFDNFEIISSQQNLQKTAILPPDVSICEDCQNELFDPNNKRFLHPFISCTNCGVRYTMTKNLPYDRYNTAMSEFEMCDECAKEYNDPQNRRYFAQTISCHKCGPKISIFDSNLIKLNFEMNDIAETIKNGNIVAIKGVGGYHLICDAANDEAVQRLRERKKRPKKPFAIMTKNIESAKEIALINQKEEELLTGASKPIVLLEKLSNHNLSQYVSFDIKTVGIFMPYTPLHLLILDRLDIPVIATSANISGEPLATNFDEISRLNHIWDFLIDHDRQIINGCDDSVVFELNNQVHFIRRARGYAPSNIKLQKKTTKKILSVGANQKNTVAIAFDDNVITSPFIGDLGTLPMNQFFEKNISNLKRIYDFEPDIIVCDRHPNYESTRFARKSNNTILHIQHHYAHILGAKESTAINEDVLGVAFDGTGYGDDGNIWGGEFLLVSQNDYKRVGHFKYFKLLGNDKVPLEPRRSALAILFDIYGENAKYINNNTINAFTNAELAVMYKMWKDGIGSSNTSSCGRIFDAVASLTGVCQISTYEGESGMMLEAMFDANIAGHYNYCISENGIIDLSDTFKAIISEKNIIIGISKFFNTLVKIIEEFAYKYKLKLVCSGGVFQNKTFCKLLSKSNIDVNFAYNIPSNDGGISLGQIVYAAKYKN